MAPDGVFAILHIGVARSMASDRTCAMAQDGSCSQPLGRRGAGQKAARPRPMQVVASAGSVHVERLAHHEQSRQRPRFHCGRVERLHGETAARHLALPRAPPREAARP